jgi:hypothetical protein
MAALLAATTLASVTSSASTPSSPAERAATAELNRNITLRNADAEDHYRLLMARHQEQMRQNEAQQRQYQADCKDIRTAALVKHLSMLRGDSRPPSERCE